MCRIDVVGLAECLLGDLPVGADDLGDVGFDTTVFKIPNLELFFNSAEEITERFAILVGVNEYESGPSVNCALGQTEILFLTFFNVREVPLCWNVGKFSFKSPCETMKWATDFFAVTVVVLEFATTMQTGVGVGLDRTVRLTHHDV